MKKDITWLAESFYNAMYPLCTDEIIAEASEHIQQGRVGEVFVEHGRVSARFTNETRRTVRVLVVVDELADAIWYRFYSALSAHPYALSKVLASSMPREFASVFSEIGESLVPDISTLKFSIDDEPSDLSDSRVLSVLEKFVGDLLVDPYLLCKLLGRSHFDIIKGLKDLLMEQGLFSKQNSKEVKTRVIDNEVLFVGRPLPEEIVVKADELPASLLRRLDYLFPDANNVQVDKNLELAYERVSRLAQSLARFM
jgi:uncharacterized Zn finger protein